MKVLFLDDDPARRARFLKETPHAVVVETADEVIDRLPQHAWDEVWLDHDLGGRVYIDSGEQNSGAEVVRWIVANRPRVKRFVVHSLNTPAALRMVDDLGEAGYTATRSMWVLL